MYLSGTGLRPNLWIHPEGIDIPFPETAHKVKGLEDTVKQADF